MALRLAYWMLLFNFLFLMCDHGNGARDVAKQDWKQVEMTDQHGSASHETNSVSKDSEMEDKKHCDHANEMKNVPKQHLKDTKDGYITAYGEEYSKESVMVQENKMKPLSTSHLFGAVGLFPVKDLFVGNIMPLYFPVKEFPQFLPREEADYIPFSMAQLPNILQLFSVPIDSPSARAMEATLHECEVTHIPGEIKLCATSLESMLDFVHRVMGSWANPNVLTTTVHPTMSTALTQNYSVLRVSKEIYAPKWVACHPLPYPYLTFFCHFTENTKIFKVLLGGENGHKVESAAVCHNTSGWDPNHIVFRELGPKYGSTSVCHFLAKHHLVWVPSPTTASI
nr:BURP domain-containing protein BNM2A-like [Quercus suber]POE96652.1 burp domain-containing protein bnm2a [Quercus suber]